MRLNRNALRFIRTARVAHLATAEAHGRPHVIPICFVFDGKYFYSPIDEKPKKVAPHQLKRLKNIRENPTVSLVIDRYDENWSKLAYLILFGTARTLSSGPKHRNAVRRLRRKYPQYRLMAIDRLPVICITVNRIRSWGRL
jgi:PPOX class probable F420-dependent enzyme